MKLIRIYLSIRKQPYKEYKKIAVNTIFNLKIDSFVILLILKISKRVRSMLKRLFSIGKNEDKSPTPNKLGI